MGPLLGGMEILVSPQPLDFVVKLLPLLIAGRDAHRETVLEDADNGAFQFSEMIELRRNLVANLDADLRNKGDGAVRHAHRPPGEDRARAARGAPRGDGELSRDVDDDTNVPAPLRKNDLAMCRAHGNLVTAPNQRQDVRTVC